MKKVTLVTLLKHIFLSECLLLRVLEFLISVLISSLIARFPQDMPGFAPGALTSHHRNLEEMSIAKTGCGASWGLSPLLEMQRDCSVFF